MSASRGHFMDRTNPGGLTDAELAAQRARRIESGCCAVCGRPSSVARCDIESAELRCGCGWSLTVSRGSRAYAQAKAWVSMRGATR